MIRPSNLHWLPNADPSSATHRTVTSRYRTTAARFGLVFCRILRLAGSVCKAIKRQMYGERQCDATDRNEQANKLFVTMFALATVNIVCISDTKSANTSSVGQQHSYPGFWLSWNYVDFKGVVTVTSFRPRARLLRSSGGRSDCCTWLGATWPPLH
jgi:hypothetical protein